MIYFIGAGPGDPELITVKGKRLIDEHLVRYIIEHEMLGGDV